MKPEHSELLADYARHAGPAEGQAAASLAALQARVSAGDLGPTPPAAPPVPAPVSEAAGLGSAVKLGLGVVGLGVAGALVWWAMGSQPAAEASRGAPAVIAQAEADHAGQPKQNTQAPEASLQAAPLAEPASAEPAAVDRAPKAAKPKPRPKPSADTGNGLGPEMELMSEARLAIGRGESQRALELLDDHKRRFRSGSFAKEREVSRVTAYCALGKTQQALRVAQAFVQRHPNSVLSDRLRQSCAGEGLAKAAEK